MPTNRPIKAMKKLTEPELHNYNRIRDQKAEAMESLAAAQQRLIAAMQEKEDAQRLVGQQSQTVQQVTQQEQAWRAGVDKRLRIKADTINVDPVTGEVT